MKYLTSFSQLVESSLNRVITEGEYIDRKAHSEKLSVAEIEIIIEQLKIIEGSIGGSFSVDNIHPSYVNHRSIDSNPLFRYSRLYDLSTANTTDLVVNVTKNTDEWFLVDVYSTWRQFYTIFDDIDGLSQMGQVISTEILKHFEGKSISKIKEKLYQKVSKEEEIELLYKGDIDDEVHREWIKPNKKEISVIAPYFSKGYKMISSVRGSYMAREDGWQYSCPIGSLVSVVCFDDEWYLVGIKSKNIISSDSISEYKCDQFDGLVECLSELVLC